MAELKAQEQDLIYALDMGTRSVVGVVGRPVGDRLKVLDVEMAEHGKRAMMDGQIDDIKQVIWIQIGIIKPCNGTVHSCLSGSSLAGCFICRGMRKPAL